jgi:hypothetical protein
MNRTSRIGTRVRLIAAAVLVGVGLVYGYSSAFHSWLGPPTPLSEQEAMKAARHLGYAAVLIVGGAWVLRSVVPRLRQETRHCAGRSGFDAVRSLVESTGLIIEEAEYHHLAFGSWVIRVDHVPPLRLVWDGKDGWAILEVETPELQAGEPIWKPVWTGRGKDEQTAIDVLKVLVEHARGHGAGP